MLNQRALWWANPQQAFTFQFDRSGRQRKTKVNKAHGARLKEASSINQSLSALGNVIKALVDIGAGKQRHVHYRDSKLTFLLKDSLGGNSKTAVIANVSPDAASLGETLSTLKFAQRAKRIQNVARVNDEVLGLSQQQLRKEIERLKDAQLRPTASTIVSTRDRATTKNVKLFRMALTRPTTNKECLMKTVAAKHLTVP